jgi:hypothetical protein
MNAFNINMSRTTEPAKFLSAIANAKGDISQRGPLIGIGVTDFNRDPTDIADDATRRLKDFADNTDEGLYGPTIQGRHLDNFTSIEDLRRLHKLSPSREPRSVVIGSTDGRLAYSRWRGQWSLAVGSWKRLHVMY